MWERFSEELKNAIARSVELAFRSDEGLVEPHSILQAMGEIPDCTATIALTNLGVSPRTTDSDAPSTAEGVPSPPLFSIRAVRILEGAVDEAQSLRHDFIGTGHLLLSLARDSGPKPRFWQKEKPQDERAEQALVQLRETLPDYATLLAEIKRLPRECNWDAP